MSKIQIEFNPKHVKGYRLIGYENRILRHEDFNDDKKDAGDIGAGHTVTALYEIIPASSDEVIGSVDPLKYQTKGEAKGRRVSEYTDELLTLKLRYKEPKMETSKLIKVAIKNRKKNLSETSDNFRYSAAVAGFGMLLRDDPLRGDINEKTILNLARNARGLDRHGYRGEFIRLVEHYGLLLN